MLRHKNIERVCLYALAVMLLITILFLALASAGVISNDTGMGYEARLFDQSRVHTIDITMDDWDSFLETATAEEYAGCQMIIDGEIYKNVAIRAKGNTSLSSVREYGNNRYSFKVEFDHYQTSMTYHGLDKLSLNNLIQDNTYLKDYTAYTLMGKMDVAAPLCSFVQINVNGEPWGVYLAVEGIEDSFLTRNYGKDHGELYKPDSMSFGGSRGNGDDSDAYKMTDQLLQQGNETSQLSQDGSLQAVSDMPQMQIDKQTHNTENTPQESSERHEKTNRGGKHGSKSMDSKGSDDVKLIYSDDNPENYTNIFSNAKTNISEVDQARLIASLKSLNEGDTSVIDTDAVLRYMAVHNFLCNDDSYTGTMIHNYYLYEEDGVMEMIPWDYNLSMGGFMGGSNATSTINTGIDDLVRNGGGDRPMADWILADANTTEQYHVMYQTFMDSVFTSGWFEQELIRVINMISPYVKEDPTAFCTYEEFENAAQTLLSFCMKRAESIQLQLSGELSTKRDTQASNKQVNASDLNLRDMGSMSNKDGNFPEKPDGNSFPAMPNSDEISRNTAGFRKTAMAKEAFAPDNASPDGKTEESATTSPPDSFTPPEFTQEGEPEAATAQTIGLIVVCAAALLTALVYVYRSKPHQ